MYVATSWLYDVWMCSMLWASRLPIDDRRVETMQLTWLECRLRIRPEIWVPICCLQRRWREAKQLDSTWHLCGKNSAREQMVWKVIALKESTPLSPPSPSFPLGWSGDPCWAEVVSNLTYLGLKFKKIGLSPVRPDGFPKLKQNSNQIKMVSCFYQNEATR